MDECAHKVGAKPAFTFASFFGSPATKESRICWSHIELLSQKENAAAPALPLDKSGSHYFAARDTDSAYLEASSLALTNPASEYEKFIFYRGVGNFATPLRATMTAGNSVTLANNDQGPLEHLFLVSIQNGKGSFIELNSLAPGQERKVDTGQMKQPLSRLSARVADALVQEGLYSREAIAMVNTWKDSWFNEDGLRVLYTLPRQWTDRTLPLTLHPHPRELVRVMVGRAEILSPTLEQNLTDSLTRASQGNAIAAAEAQAQLKKLGRFADPAMRLAMRGFTPEATETGWRLAQAATAPTNPFE
jgi:hypothetical protein